MNCQAENACFLGILLHEKKFLAKQLLLLGFRTSSHVCHAPSRVMTCPVR